MIILLPEKYQQIFHWKRKYKVDQILLIAPCTSVQYNKSNIYTEILEFCLNHCVRFYYISVATKFHDMLALYVIISYESAAYQLCHNDETYFNWDCYKIVKDRKTWFEANEICGEDGGSLVAIESELQQLFVSSYLLTNLKRDISACNITVWTAGHMMLNSSKKVYAWTRNNYMDEIDFWDDQLLMTDGGCIEIDSQSMFRDWTLVNCSNYNYFICSRPIQMNELDSTQCLCRNGYRGRFCNQSASNFGMTTFESQSVVCVDNEFEFSCPNGSSIYVDFAVYGNNGEYNKICLPSVPANLNVTNWEKCIHPASLQTMISICQGFTYCRIKNLQSLFPNSPCLPTTPISLQYRMRCLFEPMTICPSQAIYQNGRCYVPYSTEKSLSFYEAQTKCRKEGGQLAFSVDQLAQNEIAVTVRKQVLNIENSCYWMDRPERLEYNSSCECYCITDKTAFWSKRRCNSSQQWICEFAPKTQSTETQHTIFNGSSNIKRTSNAETHSLPVGRYSMKIVSSEVDN
ncbi:unnamed protein product [Cercopithifilaria johnstoni]|uniref:C-type lectin domain-containing protein n=1 Tax=Cercopithifilaria johnstoni TaxID=2874296 RepID=A0A8J2MQP1_9BILA|nr:unnamed protein product [Cercopithifilaria johnstoni]